MSKKIVYCHFYHLNGHCFKGKNCKFWHGKRKSPCPNNDKCPIKTCAEENKLLNKSVNLAKPISKDLPKITTISDLIKKPINNRIQDIPVLKSNKLVIFQSKISCWDDDLPSFNYLKSAAKIDIKKEEEEIKENVQMKLPKKNVDYIIPSNKKKELEVKRQPKILKKYENNNSEEKISRNNFLKIFSQMQSDIKQFLPLFEKVNNENQNLNKVEDQSQLQVQNNKMSLDLMFIVDCTGSMDSWISAVKNEIKNIVEKIRSNNPVGVIYYSFIGYRDYDIQKSQRFDIFNFSHNLQNFQEYLETVTTKGGDDFQEDVVGGFYQANKQKWRSEARYAVLIADAPAHGRKYYASEYLSLDSYPNGDPDGRDLEQEVKDLLRKNVSLHVIEINEKTKVMYQLMNDYNNEVTNQPLQIIKLGSSTEHFSQKIALTVNNTVSATITRNSVTQELSLLKAMNQLKVTNTNTNSVACPNLSKLGRDINQKLLNSYSGNNKKSDQNNRNYYENEEKASSSSIKTRNLSFKVTNEKIFPSLDSYKQYHSICHTYFIVKKRGEAIDWKANLLQYSYINTKICIDNTPFAEGAMRYSFFAKDTFLDQKLVVKLNKKQYESDDNLNKERLIRDLESQFICQHIVNEFNNRFSFHEVAGSNLINFVHCFIYEIKNPHSDQHKYYAAENYIEGTYEKFNNNSGWCSENTDDSGLLSQALSHFSYQITEGYLMIVDLQGVKGLYTDPQIHCLDLKRFGSGNLGYEGMFRFFSSHKCNKYCKAMGLVHPTSVDLSPINDFYSSTIQEPINQDKDIYCICDLCKVQFPTKVSYLYDRITNGMEKYCVPCNDKRINSIIESPCVKCGDQFNYSKYWYLMKRTEKPEKCVPCRKLKKFKS